jgi:hypothetical protein
MDGQWRRATAKEAHPVQPTPIVAVIRSFVKTGKWNQ